MPNPLDTNRTKVVRVYSRASPSYTICGMC